MTMVMSDSPKIGVVGCGYWGRNLVRNLAELDVLAAICDRDESSAQRYAKEYGVRERAFESVMEDTGIAGIAIATPAETHADLAERALRAGKHVFVEKPIALRVEEAFRLKALAADKRRVLMVGHLLQYHPAFLELRNLIEAGKLGPLQYVYSHRLNLGKIRREENILWSFAPHDISMILSIMGGLPDKVTTVSSSFLNKQVADITTTHLAFSGGRSAHIFVSWLHPYKEQKLVVAGENCMAVFDDTEPWSGKLKLYPHTIEWRQDMPIPNKAAAETVSIAESEPLRAELEHFISCMKGNSKCTTDADEAIRVLRVLDASERSARRNRPVELNDEDD